jgi:glycosyltransferase involved in cell wall biosynthesis
MGKNKNKKQQKNKQEQEELTVSSSLQSLLPFVSICTPTFNRRPFLENVSIPCFRNFQYPKNRMEWIIVDDGTDNVEDLFATMKDENVHYHRLPKKIPLGHKRNLTHTFCKGDIIIYMDDDDYYPPERISHAVEMLQKNPSVLCAGSSEIYLYFGWDIQEMIAIAPSKSPYHATAGTFAFKKELLNMTKYANEKQFGEEYDFLKAFSIPLVQLDPLKTILCFPHIHNTVDKRQMLKNPPTSLYKSSKTTKDFIKHDYEEPILRFFTKEMNELLQNYVLGSPDNKPDIVQKKKEIDEFLKNADEQSFKNALITFSSANGDKKQLTVQQIIELLNESEKENAFLKKMIETMLREKSNNTNTNNTNTNNTNTTTNNYLQTKSNNDEIVKKALEIIEKNDECQKDTYIQLILSTLKEKDKKINELQFAKNTIVSNETLQINDGFCFIKPLKTFNDICD